MIGAGPGAAHAALGPGGTRHAMDLVGKRVAHIRVTGRLGRGGMGEVYVGFDERLQREVALKALRRGAYGPEARSRLLREARALSSLDHPHVCRIHGFLDGEETDLLVLERVEGRTLREAPPASLGEKLRVARELTSALAAAHARGIVHRDLKPENVMLTPGGGVKVVDFGLARLVEEPLPPRPEATASPAPGPPSADAEASPDGVPTQGLATTDGSVVGTAAYMSPEQARGEPLTPASDVYSLGLLLQELFTGDSPHLPVGDLAEQLQRTARGETASPVGLPAPLRSLLADMKALAPEARPSAAQVGDRLRHFAERGRRRIRWAALATAVLLLAAGGAKYTYDLWRERNRALLAQAAAERSRKEAEQVTGLLLDVFRVSSPRQDRGEKITAREILDRGAERVQRELSDQPLVRARLLETIGTVQCQLGLFLQGEQMLRSSLATREGKLAASHPDLADGLEAVGRCLNEQDRSAEAEALLRRAVAIRQAAFGEEDARTARALSSLGLALWRAGRYPEAERAHRQALAVREALAPPSELDVAASLNNLAEVLEAEGRLTDAEPLLRRSLAIKERLQGPDHAGVSSSLNNLGRLFYETGRFAEAEPLFLRALAIDERAFGTEHPEVGNALNNLASLYDDQGRSADAERMYRRAREIYSRAFSPRHLRVGVVDNNLGEVWARQGRHEEARASFESALGIFEQALGPAHPNVAHPLVGLAELAERRGRPDEARRLYTRALAIREKTLPAGHPDLRLVREALARLPAARPR